MAKKAKPQKISLKSIFRLILFLVIIFLSINWFDRQQNISINHSDPTLYLGESSTNNVLGDMYSKLPPSSRYQIENFDESFLGKNIKKSSDYIKDQLNGFPQKQIKQLKKDIINSIANDLIKNIDGN